MSEKVLIYIHGFNSSPKSDKAKQVTHYMAEYHPDVAYEVPQLPLYPEEAIETLESLLVKHSDKSPRFIGSSLGGYMSTYLMNKVGGRAVLINPAVAPYDLMKDYLGKQINPYTRTRYMLKLEHIRELIAIDSKKIYSPERFWILLQTGDEVLDFRLAQEKYRNARLTIEQGGDHSFIGFERYLSDIVKFLEIA